MRPTVALLVVTTLSFVPRIALACGDGGGGANLSLVGLGLAAAAAVGSLVVAFTLPRPHIWLRLLVAASGLFALAIGMLPMYARSTDCDSSLFGASVLCAGVVITGAIGAALHARRPRRR